MSNYKSNKSTYLKHPEFAFSFSNAKMSPLESNRQKFVFSVNDRRGLMGWISTVLQPHEEEFLHAFKSSQRRGIVDLFRYISHNYPHLKEIVRYYIVALLIDYRWTDWSDQSKGEKEINDVFLNILIEDLAARFYRESQWLVKIMHLPIYQVFPLFDKYSKGYITIQELIKSSKSQEKQPKQKGLPARLLSEMKLKGNLLGLESKIFQQNLEELQYRVDIISFTQSNLENSHECSQSYAKIFEFLRRQSQHCEKVTIEIEAKARAVNQRALEEIDMNRQDLHIRRLSHSLIQQKKIVYSVDDKQKSQQLMVESMKKDQSYAPSNSKALSQTRLDLSKNQYLGESQSQQLKQPISYQNIQPSLKKVNYPRQQLPQKAYISDLIQAHANLQQRLQLKKAILFELQNIKQSKYCNHTKLITYI